MSTDVHSRARIWRKAIGERAMAVADLLAGVGMLAFGGALAYATARER
jgi:hypothetical protein